MTPDLILQAGADGRGKLNWLAPFLPTLSGVSPEQVFHFLVRVR